MKTPSRWMPLKVEQGAFATFLGLLVEPVGCRRWWATAVGDSCLFQVRDDQLLTARDGRAIRNDDVTLVVLDV